MMTYLIPVYILGGLLLVFGLLVLLGRFRQGRYLKPLLVLMAKVPFLDRWMKRASRAALEKQNPDLASAVRKLEMAGAHKDPQRAQKALSKLTADERKAYLEAAGAQGVPGPSNRAERRRLERARKGR
jgi:DNA-directed RNA polymerase specialized sigma24 family protein